MKKIVSLFIFLLLLVGCSLSNSPTSKVEELLNKYQTLDSDIKSGIDDVLKEYKGKTIGIVAHRAPQLAFEVITKNISWEEANKCDWRKTGDWLPGWKYDID